jgi:uncharacterized protein YndB with AHSA1/START domain
MSTDRIEKSIELNAPRSRVWRALTVPSEFGHWFGARFEVPAFEPGVAAKAHFAPTKVDPEVARMQEEHMKMLGDVTWNMLVEKIEPEQLFSFRWHPYAIDPKVDYSKETATLVEFTLEEKNGRTLLTVVESGFDKLPAERRAKAFEMNAQGWAHQMKMVEKYVA